MALAVHTKPDDTLKSEHRLQSSTSAAGLQLPLELWINIITYVHDNADLWSLYATCADLRALLIPRLFSSLKLVLRRPRPSATSSHRADKTTVQRSLEALANVGHTAVRAGLSGATKLLPRAIVRPVARVARSTSHRVESITQSIIHSRHWLPDSPQVTTVVQLLSKYPPLRASVRDVAVSFSHIRGGKYDIVLARRVDEVLGPFLLTLESLTSLSLSRLLVTRKMHQCLYRLRKLKSLELDDCILVPLDSGVSVQPLPLETFTLTNIIPALHAHYLDFVDVSHVKRLPKHTLEYFVDKLRASQLPLQLEELSFYRSTPRRLTSDILERCTMVQRIIYRNFDFQDDLEIDLSPFMPQGSLPRLHSYHGPFAFASRWIEGHPVDRVDIPYPARPVRSLFLNSRDHSAMVERWKTDIFALTVTVGKSTNPIKRLRVPVWLGSTQFGTTETLLKTCATSVECLRLWTRGFPRIFMDDSPSELKEFCIALASLEMPRLTFLDVANASIIWYKYENSFPVALPWERRMLSSLEAKCPLLKDVRFSEVAWVKCGPGEWKSQSYMHWDPFES